MGGCGRVESDRCNLWATLPIKEGVIANELHGGDSLCGGNVPGGRSD